MDTLYYILLYSVKHSNPILYWHIWQGKLQPKKAIWNLNNIFETYKFPIAHYYLSIWRNSLIKFAPHFVMNIPSLHELLYCWIMDHSEMMYPIWEGSSDPHPPMCHPRSSFSDPPGDPPGDVIFVYFQLSFVCGSRLFLVKIVK